MLRKALCAGALICAATFARADSREEGINALAAGAGAKSLCGITLSDRTLNLIGLWAKAKGVDIRDEDVQREVKLRLFFVTAKADSEPDAVATVCNAVKKVQRATVEGGF